MQRLLFVIDVGDVTGREALGGHAALIQAPPAGCGNHFATSKAVSPGMVYLSGV